MNENDKADSDIDLEEVWEAEILRRIEELDSGAVQGVPWSEVRKRLFREFA